MTAVKEHRMFPQLLGVAAAMGFVVTAQRVPPRRSRPRPDHYGGVAPFMGAGILEGRTEDPVGSP